MPCVSTNLGSDTEPIDHHGEGSCTMLYTIILPHTLSTKCARLSSLVELVHTLLPVRVMVSGKY